MSRFLLQQKQKKLLVFATIGFKLFLIVQLVAPPKPDKVENPEANFSLAKDLQRWREQRNRRETVVAFQNNNNK